MYHAAIHRASSKAFWEKQVGHSILLQKKIFDYLGDYRDSALWAKRIREFGTTPIINEPKLAEQAGRAGSAPQARTIAVAFSYDGKVSDGFAESDINIMLSQRLKEATKGNIFFTQDTAQACAIIHYTISHEFYGAFTYSGGGVANYYHTKAVMEIRAADGTLLQRKSMVNKVRKPQSSIGGDFKHINITMSVPVSDPAEILKILEKQFAAMESK